MRGRTAKPLQLKAIEGNAGKREIPTDGVQAPPMSRSIDPPAHLDERAAVLWRTLQPQLGRYVGMTELHLLGLELMCMSYGRYRLALDRLNEIDGKTGASTFETTYITHGRNGKQIKTRPEYSQALAEAQTMRSLMAEYGLTPVAQIRLKGIGQLGLPFEGDELDRLNRRYDNGGHAASGSG